MNMRIVHDNALERATTLTASSEASAQMSAAKLRIDDKDTLWRATGTAAALRLTWPAAELLGCTALAPCNFSPAATMRVRLTVEAPTTNLLASPNDFGNAAWTKTGLNITAGVAGPDGTNSGTTLTATAVNGEIKQARTVAAGNYASSIFIRRRAGAGAIYIRNAANTAWIQPSGLTTSWTRFVNDGGATGTSAVLDILIATAGDAVDICFAQLEAGPAATSYYPGARPLGYIDNWQSYAYDSGAVACCPAPAVKLRGWTAAQAASAYAYGGGAYAVAWFPQMQAVGMAIDLADPGNLQGYLEAACLVVGPYWSPRYNASDATMTPVDTTELYRKASGAQGAERGFIYRRLAVDLSLMPAADRAAFVNIVRNSRAYPILVALRPGSTDALHERDDMVYGRRTKDSDIAIQYALAYSVTIEIEEI
jgi:hypothetical protein